METDELDPERTEILQCVDQLPQASRKPVVPIDDDSVHQSLSTICHQFVEGWSTFTRTAHTFVDVRFDNLEASMVTVAA